MAKKVPLGFTATEVEVTEYVDHDNIERLRELLTDYADACEGFLDVNYVFELVAETLTDGSVKRSVRIRPAI